MRAYSLLKKHNIEVHLHADKLPSAKPLPKWAELALKIAADQFFFSSLYTLVFFMGIGMLQGIVDKTEVDDRRKHVEEVKQLISNKYSKSERNLEKQLLDLKEKVPDEDDPYVDRVLELLRQETDNSTSLTYSEIWHNSWLHCKEVYLPTFLVDCLFWPPVQLLNFSFVPVRLRFLVVNTANLLFNTFLSFQANKHH